MIGSHEKEGKEVRKFQIQIDRIHYTVESSEMSGAELRLVPTPPIASDRDVFEVIPGGQDRKIEDADVVKINNGQRFITAPAHINPGCRGCEGCAR